MLEEVLHQKVGHVDPDDAAEYRVQCGVFLRLLQPRLSHTSFHIVEENRDVNTLLSRQLPRHAYQIFLEKNLPVEMVVATTH